MINPKISVIVPVYNVEQSLKKCVDSIICQTYKNLEIILVNDGSPDNCGQICDEYAKKDERIKVIHKQNDGPANARNVGIKIASGDFLTFVDSDDYINCTMYENMLKYTGVQKKKIIVCGYNFIKGSSTSYIGCQEDVFYTKDEALFFLFKNGWIGNFSWNKLFPKETFNNVLFSTGIMFEDGSTIYKAFENSDGIVCTAKAYYNYVYNPMSITGKKNIMNEIDACKNSIERYIDVTSRLPQFKNVLLKSLCTTFCQTVYVSAQNSFAAQNSARKSRQVLTTFIKEHLYDIKSYLNIVDRTALWLICKNKVITDYFCCVIIIFKKLAKKMGDRSN